MRTPADRIKEEARTLGFALVGVARAAEADGFARLQEWLERGYAGEMAYMTRYAEARRHPAAVLPEVSSVVMVGMEYGVKAACGLATERESLSRKRGAGKISRYATGPDYHDVLRKRLERVARLGANRIPRRPWPRRRRYRSVIRARLCPPGRSRLDRQEHHAHQQASGQLFFPRCIAARLGFGPRSAPRGQPLRDLHRLPGRLPDGRIHRPRLARCPQMHQLSDDRAAVAGTEELRPGVGNWLFGCDVCQEVCPWNRKDETEPETVDAAELLSLTEDEFRSRYRGTALMRTKRRGLLRNAAVVLGNAGDERSLPAPAAGTRGLRTADPRRGGVGNCEDRTTLV